MLFIFPPWLGLVFKGCVSVVKYKEKMILIKKCIKEPRQALNKSLRILLISLAVLTISFIFPAAFSQFESGLDTICHANGSTAKQGAGASQGTVKRHIDISSPWSGGYLHEELKVVGSAEITESLTMGKPGPGLKNFFDDKLIKDSAKDKADSTAGSNPGSSQKSSSGTVSKANSDSESGVVLGISIIPFPTWFDLF